MDANPVLRRVLQIGIRCMPRLFFVICQMMHKYSIQALIEAVPLLRTDFALLTPMPAYNLNGILTLDARIHAP